MENLLIFTSLFVFVIFLGCTSSSEQTVKTGDIINIAYNLTLENGTLIDDSTNYTFQVGSPSIIRGFNYGVIGMELNETKTFSIEPQDAYGEYNQSKVKTTISNNSTLKIGDVIISMLTKEKGIVTFVNSTHVTADFNVPLAGKTLTFEVKVLNITKASDYFNP
jgi:FKBP-type peptidyl-prolyl cis-trans isomerase 2